MGHIWLVFFFNDPATTEIYTLSLHDALPIFAHALPPGGDEIDQEREIVDARVPLGEQVALEPLEPPDRLVEDRKSTRLNSSHANISYAVFCLKKTHNSTISSPQLHSTP